MTNIRLEYVHSYVDRHGKPHHYFRHAGLKRIPLSGLPGSSEFMEAYQEALAGDKAVRVEIGAASATRLYSEKKSGTTLKGRTELAKALDVLRKGGHATCRPSRSPRG